MKHTLIILLAFVVGCGTKKSNAPPIRFDTIPGTVSYMKPGKGVSPVIMLPGYAVLLLQGSDTLGLTEFLDMAGIRIWHERVIEFEGNGGRGFNPNLYNLLRQKLDTIPTGGGSGEWIIDK